MSISKNDRPPLLQWQNYAISVLSVGAALVLSELMWPLLQQAPWLVFLLAVMTCSWFGGLGVGLLVSIMSDVAINYFLIPPYTAVRADLADQSRFLTLVLAAAFIGPLSTARRRAEEQLEVRLHQQAALSALGQRALAATEVTPVMEEACRLAAATLETDSALVLELEGGVQALQARAGTGWSARTLLSKFSVPNGDSDADYAILTQVPVMVEDWLEEKRFTRSAPLAECGVVSSLNVPIYGHEKPFGVLAVHSSSRRTFNQTDVHFLQTVANLLAQALERRQAEDELRHSREQVEVILQGVTDGITAHHPDGRVVYANAAALQIFGFKSEDDVVGQVAATMRRRFRFLDEQGLAVPDERAPEQLALAGVESEATLRLRNVETGQERWTVVKATPVFIKPGEVDLVINIYRDITERKIAEEARNFLVEASDLLASSLDYATTLENLARVSVSFISEMCVIDMIDERQELHRLAVAAADPHKDEVMRRELMQYAPPSEGDHPVLDALREGKTVLLAEMTLPILTDIARDEAHLHILHDELDVCSTIITPLRARGRTLGVISFVNSGAGPRFRPRDVTLAEELARRAAAAIDNARLYGEARQARQEAEAANQAKDQFLAIISHELRTPLTPIMGWTHLLRSESLSLEDTDRALEAIERNAKSQAQLVDDLLDVSRIITGKLSLNLKPLVLEDVVGTTVETMQPAASAKEITLLSRFVAPGMEVLGDANRLQQVVWNLLSNAIKFTPVGGTVTVTVSQEGNAARVEVQDTGAGIEPEFMPHIFDRFRQGDSSTTRSHGGLGIGLSIVRTVTEMHGGTARAHSEGHNRGATFIVEMPLHNPSPGLSQTPLHGASPPATPGNGAVPVFTLQGIRVLVVDDEPDTRGVLVTLLEKNGAQVRSCERVVDALEALRAERPDVVLCDIAMPDRDGYDLLQTLLASAREGATVPPVVAVTAYAGEEDRQRALEAGFIAHVAKPVRPDDLLQVVKRLTQGAVQPVPGDSPPTVLA